jgi:hypothetical protein
MKKSSFLYSSRLPVSSGRLFLCTGLLSALLCLQYVPASATPLPYTENSWSQIQKAHAGKRHIVHFWGVSCSPCREELKSWAQFTRQHPEVPLTLVQVDEATPEQAEILLQKTGMDKIENWSLSAYISDTMRYEIDPGWVGELPYTRLTDADGKAQTLRGVADFAKIEQWLQQGRVSAATQQTKK